MSEDDVKIEITKDDNEDVLNIVQEDGSLNPDFMEMVLNSALHQLGVMPPNYALMIKEMIYEVYELENGMTPDGTQLN